jgi:hypothetical protein
MPGPEGGCKWNAAQRNNKKFKINIYTKICNSKFYLPTAAKYILSLLMFVPCITKRSINNQHYALNYTTTVFNIQASICFGSSLPSSRSFLDPSELLEMQIN